MTTTTNTYTRQNNPSSSYFHLPILLHPDQTAMDLLQHTQDTYRDACRDIVKFFEERDIDIAVFEEQYREYRNKGKIHSEEEEKSINQVKKIICQISNRLSQRFKLRIRYGKYPLASVMSEYRQAKKQHKNFNLEHSRPDSGDCCDQYRWGRHYQCGTGPGPGWGDIAGFRPSGSCPASGWE